MQLSSSKVLVFVAFAVCLAEVSAFYESNRMFLMDRNWWLRRRNQWAREPPVVVERRSAGDVVDLAPLDYELDGEPLEARNGETIEHRPLLPVRPTAPHRRPGPLHPDARVPTSLIEQEEEWDLPEALL
ncbi:hypothetical protein M3Y99_01896800 [Aphelenchoides fujianensis]|nr:hypothetical protein M3Y99_01896800 [Aphelenchoides fujianensis]